MDWTKSYSSEWRVFRVNRDTWADADKVTNIISANVTRTADGALLESGSIKITGDFEPDYYRIVLTARQGGELARVDVATLLFNSRGGEFNYGVNTYAVDGYSVLYPASTKAVTTGEYAPKGVDGARYAGDLLAGAINAPVEIEGSFILDDHVVHELGSSVLEAAWYVLNAGGFVIQIDGRGTVHIRPKPTEPTLIIDNAARGLLENGIKFTSDMSEMPNRYVIIDGVNITVVENNDPESPISIVSRGYCVDTVDTSPVPVNGESYGGYGLRMLKNLSVLKEEFNYSREFAPDVYPYSKVKATISGLEGDLSVHSQSLSCGNGITVSEKVYKETKLYDN